MTIIVDNHKAVLPSGFSFEYNAENRLFLGRDGYSLSMTFPMKGCPENIAIFGHIHRADIAKNAAHFECSIVGGKVSLFGTLSVTKITETEVQCQFSEGRCSQTVTDPFEDVLVSDLDLGAGPSFDPSAVTPSQAWKSIDDGANEVALPWVNESYPSAPNNWVEYKGGTYSWNAENGSLSWQPYLIVIAKRICAAINYDCDFTEWEQSQLRHLIICNTLPGTWGLPDYARVLPEWSVSEFFAKLELFLMCEFEFDHRARSVKMSFSKNILAKVPPVHLENVVDSYETEISRDENASCDYIAAKRLAYKECSHSMQNFYACDWYIQNPDIIKVYDTLAELIQKNKRRDTTDEYGQPKVVWGERIDELRGRDGTTVQALLYAKDVDTYFVFRSIGVEYLKITRPITRLRVVQVYVLQPVNVFGSGSVESDDVDTEELEFVPVCIMDTYVDQSEDMGNMMFLNPSSYNEDVSTDVENEGEGETRQPRATARIIEGQKDKKSGYYDEIYVGFWNGTNINPGKQPCPVIDGITVNQDWSVVRMTGMSMRIKPGISANTSHLQLQLPQVNPRQKFKFTWLSDEIPNPRAIFHIRGKRYLCEKITASFTKDGMSQKLKGEFYPLLDT